MKKHILIVSTLVLIAALPAFAASTPCVSCQANEKMAQEIGALKHENSEDRLKGGELAQKVGEKLDAFAKVPAKNKDFSARFRSLLDLSREAIRYDGEGELASSVADLLKKSPNKKEYDAWVAAAPKSCQMDLMVNKVAEKICLQKANMKGQDVKKGKFPESCLKPFDYEECVAKK